MLVNFMKRRPQLEWDEARKLVAELVKEFDLPMAKIPESGGDDLSWIDGKGIATFANSFIPVSGWQLDPSGSFLAPFEVKARPGSKVLRVVRGYSKLSLAVATSRFYGSKSRPYDNSERSAQLMAEILDSDDLLSSRFGIASSIGLALVKDDPDKNLFSLDREVLREWMEELNMKLDTLGYETLWAQAYKDFS